MNEIDKMRNSQLEGFINHLVSRHLEEYRETTDMILEESLPGPVIKARPP